MSSLGRSTLTIILLATLIALLPQALLAAPRNHQVMIRDYVGTEWSDELVHETLTFPEGKLRRSSARVTQAGLGEVACQISDVARHDDGSVESMKVWFLADVSANGTASYTIQPGAKPGTHIGVTATTAPDSIMLKGNGPKPMGVELLGGEKVYAWPVPAAEVPGPIRSILLPSGRKVGDGRFEVPFRVKSYNAEVTANGPVFAEARIHYAFDTGYWTFKARVLRNHPVIIIDEELDNGWNSQKWDKVDRFYTIALNTGSFKPTQVFFAARNDMPECEDLLKNGIKKEWNDAGRIRQHWFASPVQGFTLSFDADREFFHLSGYPAHTPTVGCLVRALEPGGEAVGFVGLDTSNWRNPLSPRFQTSTKGELLVRLPLQVYEQFWRSDGFSRYSPNYTGKTLFVPENTSRRRYAIVVSKSEEEKEATLSSLFLVAAKLGAHPLEKVRHWTLDWEDPLADADWAEKSSEEAEKVLDTLRGRLWLKRNLGHYARYSMAYHYGYSKGEYPGISKVIDSPEQLTAADRRELRRLCAYIAYDMNSRDTFPYGTGFHLNNPNMTIMAAEARVKSSLLVKDHPMFKEWGKWTVSLLKEYIRRFTRDSGATYENPHYTLGVTFNWMAEANETLLAHEIGDALDSELFRKSVRFSMDWLTPPDPRFKGHRVVLPVGNGSYQSVPPTMATRLVNYFKDRHPELASQLQWCANQTIPDGQKLEIVDETVPQLESVWYRDYGVYFRHGFGTPYETLFLLFAGNCDGHCEWEADQMTYTLYAKGQPIHLHFGNGYFPMFCRPWLRNRVSFDHQFEPSERNETNTLAASFTPETEYARAFRNVDQLRPLKGEGPLLDDKGRWSAEESKNWGAHLEAEDIPLTTWFRQVMFLKDADPKGPNYFIVRDAFAGTPTKPTDLSLWFLANSMERKGDVFHFDGQCLVDLDVFVNEPKTFEPETGKYGHVQQPYRRLTGFDPKFFPEGKRREDQLLLRIKRPPGEGYMVVLYPRLKQDDPPAKFARLAPNAVKVETPLSTDYVFLSPWPFSFSDQKVKFEGLAGAVRLYNGGKVAVVGNEGHTEVHVGGKTIRGQGAFVVKLDGGKVESRTYTDGAKVEVE